MPRVYLTAEQREAARQAARAKDLADSLLVHKALKRTTFQAMAEETGISRQALSKISRGEDVCLPLSSTLRLMELVRRE